MIDFFTRLLNAQLDVGLGKPMLWREIVGNLFGLGSAVLGMRRKVSAWPLGIVGNVLLFTVFLGATFGAPQDKNLWGQAGRQVFFLVLSVYGWVVWAAFRRKQSSQGVGVQPRWAGTRERIQLLGAAVAMFIAFYFALKALDSWGPFTDAWILTGSILATYGMARGWTEFWLIWIGVDIVGVPTLWAAQYYPSAIMYLVYGAFVLWGFFTWMRIQRAALPQSAVIMPGQTA